MSQGGAAYFAGKVDSFMCSLKSTKFDLFQGVPNGDQKASIAGAVAGAHYIRAVAASYEIPVILHTDHCAKKLLPWLDGMLDADEAYYKEHKEPLFSSHMIDLSEEEVDYNIKTTAAYLKRAAPMKQWLEMVNFKLFRFEQSFTDTHARKSVSLVVRRTVLTTRMLTIIPFTPSPRTFTRSTRLSPQSAPTSPSPPDSATSTVSTNLET